MDINEIIRPAHGSGGKKTNEIISNIILKHLQNPILNNLDDGAVLGSFKEKIVVSTDSFVVSPVFFPGGNIGKLSVCGTVNDIAVSGAIPRYLSLGLIIEAGMKFSELEKIISSIGKTATLCGVSIVTGDTKVVEKGKGDSIYINTTGFGTMHPNFAANQKLESGDVIISSGTLGDHGGAILAVREGMELSSALESDCAPIHEPILDLLKNKVKVKFMRDPTRGGAAAVLNEIAEHFEIGVEIEEKNIPVRKEVEGISELLGIEPLYLASEGRFLLIVPAEHSEIAINLLQKHKVSKDSCVIGKIIDRHVGTVVMKTLFRGARIIDMPVGEQTPRIC